MAAACLVSLISEGMDGLRAAVIIASPMEAHTSEAGPSMGLDFMQEVLAGHTPAVTSVVHMVSAYTAATSIPAFGHSTACHNMA